MIGLLAAILATYSSHFVDLNSRVVDAEHYVTLNGSTLELFDKSGVSLSKAMVSADFTEPEFEWNPVEGPALRNDSFAFYTDRIEVRGNAIAFVRQHATANVFKDDVSKLHMKLLQSGKTVKTEVIIEPADTYADIVGSSFDEGYFLQTSKSPIVVIMGVVIGLKHTIGTSWYTFVIQDGTARRLVSSMPYLIASYVDDNYIIGYATDVATGDWPQPTPDLTPKTLSPFICRISDLSVNILKKIEFVKIPIPNSEYDYFGDVYVIPKTVDPSGTLILCNRSECVKPEEVHPDFGFITKRGVYKYNVVLFRNGQAEVFGKMQVEGQTVTPTRVISAKGTFAILEGTDSKGKTVAFTYHLR